MIAKLTTLLHAAIDGGRLSPPLPVPDLACLLVRIVESFLYTDVIITGDDLDPSEGSRRHDGSADLDLTTQSESAVCASKMIRPRICDEASIRFASKPTLS